MNFIPHTDRHKFDSGFTGDRDTSFDRIRALFLSSYFRAYAEYRKSKVSLQFEDISSVAGFVKQKCSIYEAVEGLSPEQATERVFYELPVSIGEEFIRRKGTITREKLMDFLTYSDFVIEAHYRAITQRTNHLQINHPPNSPVDATDQSFHRLPAASSTPINLRDHRLFLNLGTNSDSEMEQQSQSQPASVDQLDFPIEDHSTATATNSRKRTSPEKRVSIRKKKSTCPKNKKQC